MRKLFVFVGDGGSGKTTLIAELVGKHPDKFKKVMTCTSRPMRVDEVDGEDYHFLSSEYFKSHELMLVRQTVEGYYYGVQSADLTNDTHYLLLPLRTFGVLKLVSLGFSDVAVVHITISQELKVQRMRQRGDTEEMIARRLISDVAEQHIDLSCIPLQVIDLKATDTLDKKVDRILEEL